MLFFWTTTIFRWQREAREYPCARVFHADEERRTLTSIAYRKHWVAMSLHLQKEGSLFSMILVQGERVFAHFDILSTQCAQSDAGCVERGKLPRCKLRDVPRSIHLHEAGCWRRDNGRICAARPTISHCPLSSCCSRFQWFPSASFTSPPCGGSALQILGVLTSPIINRELEYVARKTTTSLLHFVYSLPRTNLVLTSLLIEGNIGRVRRSANTEGTRIIIRSGGGDIFSSRDSSTKIRRRNANISFAV